MNKDESQLIWEQYTEQANKKPDADGDGVPDWADKKPDEDDHAEKDDNKEQVDEAKPGSALDMLGLEPEDFEHDDPDQAAIDRADAQEDDGPFGLDDESDDVDVVDLSQNDRPDAGGDRAEMLLDVIKMLEDKTFDYSFDPDRGTLRLKSNKGDVYIMKLVGAAGDHDIPISLR